MRRGPEVFTEICAALTTVMNDALRRVNRMNMNMRIFRSLAEL